MKAKSGRSSSYVNRKYRNFPVRYGTSDCVDENPFRSNYRYRRCGYAGGVAGLPTGAAANAGRYAYGATIADTGANANGCRRYADAGTDRNPGGANAVSYSNADGNGNSATDADCGPDPNAHAAADPVAHTHTGRPLANRRARHRRPHPG